MLLMPLKGGTEERVKCNATAARNLGILLATLVIARGPKVGKLFPMQFTIPITLSFSSIIVTNKSFKHRLPLVCSTCKLGKSKILHFPTYGGRANTCFTIIHSDVWGITPVISDAQCNVLLPSFEDISSPIEHFKLGMVYQRRQPPLPQILTALVVLPKSFRIRHPLDRYVFSATLAETTVLTSYS
ncbi:hypothetical protein L6164_033386 [Bauhinia variegata]|uniref:Uncharacterized protein n=1 Tax=Bauhinia variegata TaxID=167791 RepID=A0ACB9KRL2_BAUVA|nr:hypothetical protein L6164_033386 [Bauhinia variegata]